MVNTLNPDFIPQHPLNTAVLFLVFNRLDTTKQVFEAIRRAKPPRLYIAADGARENREGEDAKVNAVREYVLSNIDWECDVKTLFREKNLGCKYAVSNAITWFFENEEMGIILEDDCLPSQSFFWFCEELLKKYKEDMKVWHIGGASTIPMEMLINNESYYFSNFNHIWGWATWANRWHLYDVNMLDFPEFKNKKRIKKIIKNKFLQYSWLNNFESVYNQQLDTWDYQWCFTTWLNNAISITPTHNLISNIGFGVEATHTKDVDSKIANMPKKEIALQLIHPPTKTLNVLYDNFNAKYLFNATFLHYLKNALIQIVKKLIKKEIKTIFK